MKANEAPEKYISKSDLVAEIEKLVDKGKYHEEYDCAHRDGNNSALYALKGKINTLEVKEVELTWEDVREICTQSVLVEIDLGGLVSDERHYTEVLKRFKEKNHE